MKEEYEAQERERLAALKESRGQDDDEVEEETMIADFDGVMWGFPTGPSKPDQSQGKSTRKKGHGKPRWFSFHEIRTHYDFRNSQIRV